MKAELNVTSASRKENNLLAISNASINYSEFIVLSHYNQVNITDLQ